MVSKTFEISNGEAWVGVDFDGTLAHYDTWMQWNKFGAPLAPMVERVRRYRAEGTRVKILTARVSVWNPRLCKVKSHKCRTTGEYFSHDDMVLAIQGWYREHVLDEMVPVTCVKDYNMIRLYDDRAVQMVPNTGRTLAEEHEAERTAARGVVFGGGLMVCQCEQPTATICDDKGCRCTLCGNMARR